MRCDILEHELLKVKLLKWPTVSESPFSKQTPLIIPKESETETILPFLNKSTLEIPCPDETSFTCIC